MNLTSLNHAFYLELHSYPAYTGEHCADQWKERWRHASALSLNVTVEAVFTADMRAEHGSLATMSDRGQTGEFELQVGISDDIIAEALKSVEKHIKPNAESAHAQDAALDTAVGERGDEVTDEITDAEMDPQFEDLAGLLDVAPPVDASNASSTENTDDSRIIERLKHRVSQLTRDNDALHTALREKNSEAEKNFDRVLWLSAELDNLRKRMAREKADMEKFGNERLLRELLQVVDNLERTLKHTGTARDIAVLEEGVEMTLTQFQGCLRRFGVVPIELSPGTPFDPAIHEAMMQEETDEFPPNTIVREFQRGYMYHERLLRASLVTVARASASWSAEEGDEITTELADDYIPPGAESESAENPPPTEDDKKSLSDTEALETSSTETREEKPQEAVAADASPVDGESDIASTSTEDAPEEDSPLELSEAASSEKERKMEQADSSEEKKRDEEPALPESTPAGFAQHDDASGDNAPEPPKTKEEQPFDENGTAHGVGEEMQARDTDPGSEALSWEGDQDGQGTRGDDSQRDDSQGDDSRKENAAGEE